MGAVRHDVAGQLQEKVSIIRQLPRSACFASPWNDVPATFLQTNGSLARAPYPS